MDSGAPLSLGLAASDCDALAVRVVERAGQLPRERAPAEVGDDHRHVFSEPPRAEEPRGRAHDQTVGLDHHLGLYSVSDLVVERLDLFPERRQDEDLAREQMTRTRSQRAEAGDFHDVMHECAAHRLNMLLVTWVAMISRFSGWRGM